VFPHIQGLPTSLGLQTGTLAATQTWTYDSVAFGAQVEVKWAIDIIIGMTS